jgi:hypothetical protein
MQRKAHREHKITEDSIELCKEGIEQVQRVHKRNFVSSSEIREVSKEDTYRVSEYSVGSARRA